MGKIAKNTPFSTYFTPKMLIGRVKMDELRNQFIGGLQNSCFRVLPCNIFLVEDENMLFQAKTEERKTPHMPFTRAKVEKNI